MATISFFTGGKKRTLVPIYCRFSSGRGVDLKVKTGLFVNPARWSNETESIRQRVRSDNDETLIKNLKSLSAHIETEFKANHCDYTRAWLEAVIYKFHHKRGTEAKDLNDYISLFIKEAEAGIRKSKSNRNLADGTIRAFKGFQRIFSDYEGIYSEKRLKEIEDENLKRNKENKPLKELRPLRKLDFEDITPSFYTDFIRFLSDEGYKLNTQGKFIKSLKTLMKKARRDKLHTNRDYEFFDGISEDTFAVYLTSEELDKIFNYDLTQYPRMAIARDCFLILCETCLRISDYPQIDVNITTYKGKEFIDIHQQKTKGRVVIPLTPRFKAIWKRNGNKLPYLADQYVNRFIKTIACWCKIDEEVHWTANQFGKEYPKSAKKYQLITCHTGRRTGATNMYLADVPLKTIRAITGHKTDKQLLEYIKADELTLALKASEHPYFSGLKAV
jgi:hypothetical protein